MDIIYESIKWWFTLIFDWLVFPMPSHVAGKTIYYGFLDAIRGGFIIGGFLLIVKVLFDLGHDYFSGGDET